MLDIDERLHENGTFVAELIKSVFAVIGTWGVSAGN